MDIETRDQVVIRFAGDSGDGMQLLGSRFTHTAALLGNDLATLPDYPAEIRAPAGTRGGVSGFQIQFAARDIFTPGDESDVLVAMNPAALVTNLHAVKPGGLIIVNTNKFAASDLKKAQLDSNPLEDGTLEPYRIYGVPISDLTAKAVEPAGLNVKQADRCKNFFALGMMLWMHSRSTEDTRGFIEGKFRSPYKEANLAALEAGWSFADTVEYAPSQVIVGQMDQMEKGRYRNITGNQAIATGLVVAAHNADRPLFYGSYPITPASDVLHALARFKEHGVVTFQAEDEIAAVCAAIGASYGGSIGVTGTSGPGLALKGEALGLAVMTELPLVIVSVQRGGPSTGLPTKTEQSDLLQGLFGRNGESPMAVIAPTTPGDCFAAGYEAVQIALRHMIPVLILSDGYLGNGAEPWLVPEPSDLPDIVVADLPPVEEYQPYMRDPETLARPWPKPGDAGYEHRIGGLEKQDLTGDVYMDPDNHQLMTDLRQAKLDKIADFLPPTEVHGSDEGVLVLGWGSTYGAIREAVNGLLAEGVKVAHVQVRNISPLPKDLGEILARYDKVLVPEMNMGQLNLLIRSRFLVDTVPLNKVQGQPFKIREIAAAVKGLATGGVQ